MEGKYGRAETTVASVSPAAVHTVGSLEEALNFLKLNGLTFYLQKHKIELK
jgi:hypothetical protein